jgi:hypothetical protein
VEKIMRILKTEDCFYVAGGEEGGGNTDSGPANDSGDGGGWGGWGGSDSVASGPSYGLALAVCSVVAATTPTPPGFITACVRALTGGKSGGESTPRDFASIANGWTYSFASDGGDSGGR